MGKYINIRLAAPIILVIAITWLYPAADLRDTRYSAYFRFGVCAYTLFSVLMWKTNKWVSMFMILAGISSLHPISSKYSQGALIAVSIGCAWYYLISSIRDNGRILDAICIVAVTNSIWSMVQYCGYDPIFLSIERGSHPVVGLLSNKNEVSALLAICLPAFFRHKWKYLVPVIFLGLWVSASTGGMLAAVACSILYLVLKQGKKIYKNAYCVIILLAFIAVFVYVADPIVERVPKKTEPVVAASVSARLTVWRVGAKIFRANWIYGIGVGHWKVLWSKIKTPTGWWKQAHNEFIQTACEMGIGFVLILVGYLTNIVKSYKKEMILPVCALCAVMVNSSVNFPFHIAQTAIVALTWMAMLASMQNQPKETNKCQTTN